MGLEQPTPGHATRLLGRKEILKGADGQTIGMRPPAVMDVNKMTSNGMWIHFNAGTHGVTERDAFDVGTFDG
jgi:hypothetical protein